MVSLYSLYPLSATQFSSGGTSEDEYGFARCNAVLQELFDGRNSVSDALVRDPRAHLFQQYEDVEGVSGTVIARIVLFVHERVQPAQTRTNQQVNHVVVVLVDDAGELVHVRHLLAFIQEELDVFGQFGIVVVSRNQDVTLQNVHRRVQ